MSKTTKIILLVVGVVVLLILIAVVIWFVQRDKFAGLFNFSSAGLFSRVTNPMENMPDISPIKEGVNVFAKTETNPYSYAYENPF
ncbi:MAG: hypothetical protein HY980_01960 [Candidatus Magasanikbacteria bacterium]|nr:hypothetical protein [Candidatus Magasanikbacteria bacterium]